MSSYGFAYVCNLKPKQSYIHNKNDNAIFLLSKYDNNIILYSLYLTKSSTICNRRK